MTLFVRIFWTFFKIGLFGFGGGYAMISMIQSEVIRKFGITPMEFTDMVAISQMTPGAIGINAATYIGYTATLVEGYAPWVGFAGSAMATGAVVLPSFVLMIGIGRFFIKYHEHVIVETTFRLLRPVVVGLVAAAALVLMTPENFGLPDTGVDASTWTGMVMRYKAVIVSSLIFVGAFVGVRVFKIGIIPILVASAAVGIALC